MGRWGRDHIKWGWRECTKGKKEFRCGRSSLHFLYWHQVRKFAICISPEIENTVAIGFIDCDSHELWFISLEKEGNLLETKRCQVFHSHKRNSFPYDPTEFPGNHYLSSLGEEHRSRFLKQGDNEGGVRMVVEKAVESLSSLCGGRLQLLKW